MKIHRYITKTVCVSTATTLCLLLGIDVFFNVINELRFVGTGEYALIDAVWFLVLGLPQQSGQWFAFSVLLGTLLGLGLLEQQQELLILRVSSMSLVRLASIVLGAGLLMVLCMLGISEGFAPSLNARAQEFKAYKMSAGQAMLTTQGTWFRDGIAFVHVRSIRQDGTLQGVTQYDVNAEDQSIQRLRRAEEGSFENGYWHLKEVVETTFLEDKVLVDHLERVDWHSHLDPSLLRVVGLKHIEELSMGQLWQLIRFRQENNLDHEHILLTLWQKILQPVNALILMLVAFPFVFGPLRGAGVGARWFSGILVGCFFYLLNGVSGSLSLALHISPLLGAAIPSVLFLGIAGLLLYRVR